MADYEDEYNAMIFAILVFVGILILWLFKKIVFKTYLKNHPAKSCLKPFGGEDPGLGTWNGFGCSLLGGFREDHMGDVVYNFFFILGIPIFPCDCYRIDNYYSESYYKGASHGEKYSFRIRGYEKWNFLEVIYCYLDGILYKALILGGIYMIVEISQFYSNQSYLM